MKTYFEPKFKTEDGGCKLLLPYNLWVVEFDENQMKHVTKLKSEFSENFRSEKPKPQKGRILLMDDEDMIRKITGSILMRIGYDSEVSKEGSEAINIYQQAMNSEYPFDAVILDLNVKAGLGGLDTIKALKAMDSQVKAIVTSGLSNDPVMTHFKEYGFQGVLPKPFKIKDIEDELHKISIETAGVNFKKIR